MLGYGFDNMKCLLKYEKHKDKLFIKYSLYSLWATPRGNFHRESCEGGKVLTVFLKEEEGGLNDIFITIRHQNKNASNILEC